MSLRANWWYTLHLDWNGKENKSITMELHVFGWDFFVVCFCVWGFICLFLICCGKIWYYTPEICNLLGSIRCACEKQAERIQQRKPGWGCWDRLGTDVRPTQSAAQMFIWFLTDVVIILSFKLLMQVGLCLYFSYSGWSGGLMSLLLHLFPAARTYFLRKSFFRLSQLFASTHVSHSCGYKWANNKQSNK